ncbi:MAG: hypothetical protein JWP63_6766 [Candidatus Solibacter sp.]|jgi:hypothetical protein|nr:hypothetical protein [Candidatus Solibacter sp.]
MSRDVPPDIDDRHREIGAALRQYFAEVDASRQFSSPEEFEAVVDEAMRSTRPGYRSRR